MSAESLEGMLIAKDPGAPRLARQLGAAASEAIDRGLSNPDFEVRLLALECVDAVGGPQRNPRLIKSLEDSDINVRSAACRLLYAAIDRNSLPLLLKQLRQNPDEYVRGEVALMIGLADDPGVAPDLRLLAGVEKNADVHWKMTLSLARLKDEAARSSVRARLQSGNVRERYNSILSYEYINDSQALADLSRALDDQTDAFNIMPAHTTPRFIRICDAAVNVISKVGKAPLKFNGAERRRFSGDELREVSAWLRAQRK